MSQREIDANGGSGSIDALIQYPEEGQLNFHDNKYEFDAVRGSDRH